MIHPVIIDILKSSKLEQLPVVVYFPGGTIKGIVADVQQDIAELRTTEGKRCAILLEKINAIMQE